MIPVGYMAKCVYKRPDWLKASHVADIFSVSNCVSEDFADYINFWKHNGFWLFDSPEVIKDLARENSIQLEGMSWFYYEAYEMQFDQEGWHSWSPEPSLSTAVVQPFAKDLEGFDVVTFRARNAPEHSPLSCNSMAEILSTNAHCLFESFDDAKKYLDNGSFKNAEPGPYRIFSVCSIEDP